MAIERVSRIEEADLAFERRGNRWLVTKSRHTKYGHLVTDDEKAAMIRDEENRDRAGHIARVFHG